MCRKGARGRLPWGERARGAPQALEALRVKGLAQAGKKAGRVASEGLVASYIHAGSK